MKAIRFIIITLLALLAGCSEEALSPEDEISRFIDRGIEAAEDRDVGALMEMVHDQYSDRRGMSPKTIRGTLRLYFLRHKNIHLFKRIDDIILRGTSEASASLFVAMAGTVISDITALGSLRARIYHFDLTLVKEGDWRVKEAVWKPATLADLQSTY